MRKISNFQIKFWSLPTRGVLAARVKNRGPSRQATKCDIVACLCDFPGQLETSNNALSLKINLVFQLHYDMMTGTEN